MNPLQRAAIVGLLREAAEALKDHGCTPEHEEHPDLMYRLIGTANAIEEAGRHS